MKNKVSKIKRVAITTLAAICAFASVSSISAAAAGVSVSATKSKVSVTLTSNTNTTLVIYKVSCREKHSQTGAQSTVTGDNSTGNGTSVIAVIKPHTGYNFINASSSYNYYRYSISGSVAQTVALPKIS